MTPANEHNLPTPLQTEIQSRHPGIGEEIQGAINTLQKLQQITGAASEEQLSEMESADSDAGAARDARRGPTRRAAQAAAEFGSPIAGQGMGRKLPLLAASESFGRYQIVRMLGQGAMGAVYLAYDSQLQRHVALKTPFLGNKSHTVERFYREARAAAQLRSPYICPIYEVGEISGIHYYSMAFIEGRSLARLIADGEMRDVKSIVEMTKKVARGLHKAHELGIMHRDIKPENIMVDSDGEPIVMDFGLARRVDDETQLTVAGSIFGTPVYMSPEQVEGKPNKIGPATDMYSLGVMLYQMLTGRLPFQGSLTSVLHQITHDEPAKPSTLNLEMPHDLRLERICLKMMAKSSADRFPSMAAVVEALEQLDAGSKASATKTSFWKRVTLWATGLFRRRTPARDAASAPAASSARAAPSPLSHVPPLGPGDTGPGAPTLDVPMATSVSDPNSHTATQTIDLPSAESG